MGDIIKSDSLGVNFTFYDEIRLIIYKAQEDAIRSVDVQRVLMYWKMGERIFLEEQRGEDRAKYGTYLVKNLAKQLEPEFGSGFSVRQLERSRQFYRTYPIASALRSQLNWMQYRLLIAIDDEYKRETSYYEKDIESAIITHLQEFLLEMGNGFAFMARQKRLLIEDDEFFADLLFYNRLLRCFVVIEIKNHKITHQDIGQLQMYVNYFDRYEKLPEENPTVGILLCADKNDTLVRITLPEDNTHILTSQYQLYLPSEQVLLEEIKDVLDLAEGGGVDG